MKWPKSDRSSQAARDGAYEPVPASDVDEPADVTDQTEPQLDDFIDDLDDINNDDVIEKRTYSEEQEQDEQAPPPSEVAGQWPRPSVALGPRLVREFVGHLAGIRPGFVLVFKVTSELKRFQKTFIMRRVDTGHQVLFRIHTNRPDGYRVKPCIGVLPPPRTDASNLTTSDVVFVVVTILPHTQFQVEDDLIVVECLRVKDRINTGTKRKKLESIWKTARQKSHPSDRMEHALRCAINVNEFEANDADFDLPEFEERQRHIRSVGWRSRPTMRKMLTSLGEYTKDWWHMRDWEVVTGCDIKETDYELAERDEELMLRLVKTSETLQQKTKCFRCFQIFVIVAIFVVCAMLAVLVGYSRIGHAKSDRLHN